MDGWMDGWMDGYALFIRNNDDGLYKDNNRYHNNAQLNE
jgi:hypothetical protein